MDNYELFEEACRKGNLKKIESLLNKNSNLIHGKKNENNIHSLTPLAISLINHKLKVASYLLDLGANINQEFILDKVKTYLLHTIIEFEVEVFYEQENSYPEKIYISNIEFAIKNNALINNYNEKGYTPLDIALKYDHYTGANYLHQNGAKHSKKMFNDLDLNNKTERELNYYLTAYQYLNKLKLDDCIETKDRYVYPIELPSFHKEIYRTMNNHLTYLNNYPLKMGYIKDVYDDEPDSLNYKDSLGRTPVDYAIELGHTLAVDYLKSIGGKTSEELDKLT